MNRLFPIARRSRMGCMMGCIIGCMMIMSCSGSRPDNLGISGDRLADCPKSPNCVSSQATGEKHAIPPFTYEGSKENAFSRLKNAVTALNRTQIVEERANYLRVECTSAILRFKDDLEFYFPEENIIHVRSASRLGYSDLGVNRKRVEKLRQMFHQQSSPIDNRPSSEF